MARQRMYALTLLAALLVCAPMAAWGHTDPLGKVTQPNMDIGYSLSPNNVHISTPGQGGVFFSKLNSVTDTVFGLRAITSVTRFTDTFYSDTIGLTADAAQTPTDTKRQAAAGETTSYILSVTNLGNTPDSIGFVIDTIVLNGYTGVDTNPYWTLSFYDSRGVSISAPITKRGADTILFRLNPTVTETFTIKVGSHPMIPETCWINFRLRSYVANANPAQFAVGTFRGFNGDTYGGDGHDSMSLFAEIKVSSKLRVSKTDTAFSPITLAGGTLMTPATDTQHRIPGAIVVHTVWFDNDDTTTADTIVLDDWIDTRYVRFDSAGLTNPAGGKTQTAAGSLIAANYGNIFRDSGMPTDLGAGVRFIVTVQYRSPAGVFDTLTVATPLDNVDRLRWTITKINGSAPLVGVNNNDDSNSIDAAPIAAGAATDLDFGYVRYAVVIRTDTTPTAKTGRPDSGVSVGGNVVAAGQDSAFIESNNQFGSRNVFTGPFTVELLPIPNLSTDTRTAQKAQVSTGDTFYFAHQIANYGNSVDSLGVSGTTTVSGGYVTVMRDIGGIGVFDGIESKMDTVTVNMFASSTDTIDILVAVFVPGSFSGKDTAYIRVTSARNRAFFDSALDLFTVIGVTFVTPADSQPPAVIDDEGTVGISLILPVPPTVDSVVFSTGKETYTISIDSTGKITSSDSRITVTYDSSTGILSLVIDSPATLASDTYTWSIAALEIDSGVVRTIISDSGVFVVDTAPPFFSDSQAVDLLVIDTTLTGTETAVTIRIVDTALGDTHTGIDSIVIIIMDTAGNVIRTDTIDSGTLYQLTLDTAGTYIVTVVAIDIAGNTMPLGDSVAFVIPTRRSITVVAKDKQGVLQPDDVAKGLTAQGTVTVSDPSANTNAAAAQSISVTVRSDVDPIGITLELFESGANTGVFEESFGFTNGVSNNAAKKIQVRDGSLITATYDADGKGPIAAMSDAITWQGILVQGLDKVRTWPNPYNQMTDPCFYIQNLPPDPEMTIEIYTLNGDLIHTMRVGSGITFSANQNIGCWDARTPGGKLIASGTFVYVVKSKFGTVVRRMTIVH